MAMLLRISLIGAMPSGEEWSINPVYAIGGDFGTDVSYDEALAIATAVATVTPGADIRSWWSSSTTFIGARVEARDLDGSLQVVAEYVRPSASAGTGTNYHPFQTAQVVSLRTATPGARARGRLYVPATAVAVTASTLRVGTSQVTSFLTAMELWLSDVEAAIEATVTGVSLCVWSRASSALFPVTRLLAGDVLDTQRRRRDVAIEAYQSVAYTA